ncbi:MAG: N-acetylmannosamine-6-phosphate 2-epimerase [Armatimonadetes bacterium]|nr:N-acetylmannosamine-6-phosphate 2-epimerase [Armatimonadota bacterium]
MLLERIKGGLIVSCQAGADSPLHGPVFMSAMAKCAQIGGAVGIRANGAADIKAIKEATGMPVVGINKKRYPGSEVYITPLWEDAEEVIAVGSDIVAMDGTPRPRPNGVRLAEVIEAIHRQSKALVMADISNLEDARFAKDQGADIIATTMSGYTPYTADRKNGPDLDLISRITSETDGPIIAEGRFWTPEQAAEALRRGAWAVVVGTAITAPQAVTSRFAQAMRAL